MDIVHAWLAIKCIFLGVWAHKKEGIFNLYMNVKLNLIKIQTKYLFGTK